MRRIELASIVVFLCASMPAFPEILIKTRDGRTIRVQVDTNEIASIDFVPTLSSQSSRANPIGSWRNNNASTWVITSSNDGRYSAQEHGLGNAKGTGYFMANGAFRIDYTWSGGSGFYEVRFASDNRSAKGFCGSPSNPCTWVRIDP